MKHISQSCGLALAVRLSLSKQAERDIDEIVDYVAVDNPAAARTLALRIERFMRLLTERPYMGPPAPESGQRDMRRMSLPPYIVFYRVGTESLSIARVLHSSRCLDVEDFFQE